MILTSRKCRLGDQVEVFIEKLDRKRAAMISPALNRDGIICLRFMKNKSKKELTVRVII